MIRIVKRDIHGREFERFHDPSLSKAAKEVGDAMLAKWKGIQEGKRFSPDLVLVEVLDAESAKEVKASQKAEAEAREKAKREKKEAADKAKAEAEKVAEAK